MNELITLYKSVSRSGQLTWGGHNAMWLLGQSHLLRHHVEPTHDHGNSETNECTQGLEILGDLCCKFSCRCQDERVKGLWFVEKALDDGYSEGGRLARARLC